MAQSLSGAAVVGIDLGASHLHFALANARGDILKDLTEKIRPEDGPRKIIRQIIEAIREITGSAFPKPKTRIAKSEPRFELRGIGIGVPSPVDAERGAVALAANLPGWRKVRLGHELEKEFHVPVSVENDANMAAIGERWRGVAQGVDNFVFIALGTGIGSGIFINGKLYRGHTGSAGELHGINLEWQRWGEDFGDVGFFERHASGLGIAAEGRRVLGLRAVGTLQRVASARLLSAAAEASRASPLQGLAERRDAYFVFEAFRRGNLQARAVLDKVFTILGVGIANIIAILDPDLIVLGGGVTKGAPKLLLSTVNKVVRRIHKNRPPIRLSLLGDKAQTFGAIFAALNAAPRA